MTPTQAGKPFDQPVRRDFRARARIARIIMVSATLASIATMGLLMVQPRATIDSLAIALALSIIWLSIALLGAFKLRQAMRGGDTETALAMLMLAICIIITGFLAAAYLPHLFD